MRRVEFCADSMFRGDGFNVMARAMGSQALGWRERGAAKVVHAPIVSFGDEREVSHRLNAVAKARKKGRKRGKAKRDPSSAVADSG